MKTSLVMFQNRCLLLLSLVVSVWGHGRLIDPASRSSMWRYGFNTPKNYNDNELFCGGFGRQWERNGGKCGICGDPWDAPEPRANEEGGIYGKGIVVREYKAGEKVTVRVDLTTPHRGYFQFRLCSLDGGAKADQACLDKNVLQLADGSGDKFYPGASRQIYSLDVNLPTGFTCNRCVFQWDYRTGNRWGKCDDGTFKTGCGPQETFRGCADVSIKA